MGEGSAIGEDSEFDHIVITQFSAVFESDGSPVSDDWCWYRLAIFRDLLCRSIASQATEVSFTWLVYFDDRCGAEFRAAVDALAEGLFTPVWTHDLYWSRVREDVARYSSADYLITTRIDSDDAVSRKFLACVQEQFARQEFLFVTFPRGLQLDGEGRLFRYDEPTGPFMSLIERRGSALPSVVLSQTHFSHGLVRGQGDLKEVITADPMWMQYIHGTNINNRVRGLRAPADQLARNFEVGVRAADESRLRLVRGWVVSLVRRTVFWAQTPYYAIEWLDATRDRRRGTHTKPARAGGVHGPPLLSFLVRVRPRRMSRRGQ